VSAEGITMDPTKVEAITKWPRPTSVTKVEEEIIRDLERLGIELYVSGQQASSSANKKPEYVKSVEKKEDKKADEKKRDMSKVKCYNCEKEGYFSKDCKKAKVKHYNYYKTKMLLAKKDSAEQVLLTEDQAWMESSSDSDQEINANMVFMAQIKKVFQIQTKVLHLLKKPLLSESEYETSEYYDNTTTYDEALEIEKFKRARENKIEFAYDYGNLNASYVNEKINFSDDYFQEIINLDFENIDSLFQQTSSLKPYVPTVILKKIIIDLEDEVIYLWIIDSGCSKHMTGNRALLINFVEKFIGTVRFGNNDFAVIAGYGDVVNGSMTIKKVYYVEGLIHNLFSVGQFCEKGLEVAF
nr:integrase, catalytic region, zinc finger, CCHC-type, peptidase aspartic, catalytic [Tanacetum cinerariifolium]